MIAIKSFILQKNIYIQIIKRKTSYHDGDFYCLNYLHPYKRGNKLKKHEKICKDHDFCDVKTPGKDNNTLKHHPGEKSLEHPFIKYVALEYLLQKTDTCQYNPEKSDTENKALRVPSGYSLVTCSSFDKLKTECKYYRGKDCIEKLCKHIGDQETKLINYEKKKEKKKYYYLMKKKGFMKDRDIATYENIEKLRVMSVI